MPVDKAWARAKEVYGAEVSETSDTARRSVPNSRLRAGIRARERRVNPSDVSPSHDSPPHDAGLKIAVVLDTPLSLTVAGAAQALPCGSRMRWSNRWLM